MDTHFLSNQKEQTLDFTGQETVLRKFFTHVFTYMSVGLAISATVAYWFGNSSLINILVGSTGLTAIGYVVIFSPLVFTLFLGKAIQRLSTTALMLVFSGYSIVMGMSLSFIFLVYTDASIVQVFFVTALTFAVFAVLGYTTKTDLTKLGTILGIAFLVLIVVSLLNFFLFKSEQVSYIMSGIGVVIVVGLIAYHIQQLKRIGSGLEYGSMEATKLALIGAFTLYVSFINLFMFLLRLFGKRE